MSVTSFGSSIISSTSQKDEDTIGSFESNAAAAIEKVSSLLLDLSYTLSLESSLPYWFVVFSMALEFFQQAHVLLPNDDTPPLIPWGMLYTEWIRDVTHFFSTQILEELFGSAFTVPAIGSIIVLYAGAGAISYFLSRGETPNIILVRTIAILAKILSSILYLPLLLMFMDLMWGDSVAVSIFSAFFFVCHFFAALLSTVAINDIDILSQDPKAQVHCRIQTISLLFNTALVFSGRLLQDQVGVFVVVNTASSIYVAVTYTKYCPYNAESLNYIQSGFSWAYSWTMSAALVSVIQNDTSTSGPTFIVFGGVPVVFLAGAFASKMKMKSIMTKSDKEIGDPYQVERKIRLILRQGFRASLLDQSVSNKKLENDSDDERQKEAMERARRILVHAMIVHSESSLLPLLAGLLYFNFFRMNFVGYEFLKRCEQISPAIDMRVLFFRLQRDNERKILLDEANRDVNDFNQYNDLLMKAQDYDLSLTKSLVSFWCELSELSPDIKLLRSLSVTVSQDSVQALTLYQQALRIYGDSALVLKTYAGLLSSLLQDSMESNRLLARAKEIEMRRKNSSGHKEESFRNVLFSDYSSVIVISGRAMDLGKILNVNSFAPQMFGIPESSMVGANISIIMPEPFASAHTALLRRNLTSGRSFVTNQRRPVPILHHSGYILETNIHVRMFIRDLTDLCFIGVFELASEEQIILVIDSQAIVRSISFTAVQQFGVTQAQIKNNQYSIENLLTDYDSKRSLIISNKSCDRQWTEFVQVIGDTRFRLNLQVDVYSLPGDRFADVLRISVLESEPALNPDRWTLNSGSSDERLENSASIRRRLAANNQQALSVSESFNIESARKIGDSKSQADGGKTAPSESGRSSGASSAQSIEVAKRRDQITVSWLRRSIQTCLVLISLLTLASYLFASTLDNYLMALIEVQKLCAERELMLVSIALISNKLGLLRDGLLTDQTEDDLRSQLHFSALRVFQINEKQMSTWPSISKIDALYLSSLSNLTASSLLDDLTGFSSKAEQIRQLPLSSINERNVLVAFLEDTILQILDKLLDIIHAMDEVLETQLGNYNLLLLVIAVFSFLLISALCMFELRPAVDNIFLHSTLVFLKFFDIPPECIGTTLEPLVNRLKSLSQAGDQTTIGAVDLMSIEAKIAFGENEKVKRSTKVKAERARETRIRNVVLSNQTKMIRDSGLISKVFVIIAIYLIYFCVDTFIKVDFAGSEDLFNHKVQDVRQLHTYQRLSLLVLAEYIENPSKRSYDEVEVEIAELFSKFDKIVFGDKVTGVPEIYTVSQYQEILFGNLCSLIIAQDCETFASGSSTLGLQMLMATFRMLLYEELNTFQTLYETLPNRTSIPSLTALARSRLQSPALHTLWRMDNEFLYPTIEHFASIRLQLVANQKSLFDTVYLLLLFSIFIMNIVIYVCLGMPFLQRLVREFEHSRVLLRLIPNTLRGVIVNTEEDKDEETYIRLAQVINSGKPSENVNQPQPRHILYLKLRRLAVAIYGCAFKRRNLALGIIVTAILGLWMRFFDFLTAQSFYAAEYSIGMVVAFGAFLSTSTATASMPLGPGFYNIFHPSDHLLLADIILFGSFTESIARAVAVLYLIVIGYPQEWKFVLLGALSSMVGSIFGHLLLFEHMVLSYQILLVCILASMCSVGIAIAICSSAFGDSVSTSINFDRSAQVDVIVVGIVGGLINSLVGFSLVAFMFGLATLYFRLNSQIATSSSISIGCLNSVFNLIVNLAIGNGLKSHLTPYLVGWWPFVVAGAAIGTYTFSRLSSSSATNLFLFAIGSRFLLVIVLLHDLSDVSLFVMGSSMLMMTAMFVVLGVGGYIRTVASTSQ